LLARLIVLRNTWRAEQLLALEFEEVSMSEVILCAAF
jgi:hypothetical protein